MDKVYTPDEIIADLKELIASIEEIKNDPKPELERLYEVERQFEHITAKNIPAQVIAYGYAKRYGNSIVEQYLERPDGAVEAER